MLKWIKRKLQSFLGVEDLIQEVNSLERLVGSLNSEINKLYSLNNKVIQENNAIMKQFNVSADIYQRGDRNSWAVISIQGKPEYIRFVNMSNKDMHEIHSFLKQFERTNMTIDSPYRFFRGF